MVFLRPMMTLSTVSVAGPNEIIKYARLSKVKLGTSVGYWLKTVLLGL